MKTVAILLTFISCWGMGLAYSAQKRARCGKLRSLISGVRDFVQRLSYSRTPLCDLIDDMERDETRELLEVYLKSGAKAAADCMDCLQQREKGALKEFLSGLDAMGAEQLKEKAQWLQATLTDCLAEAESEAKGKGRAASAIGLIGGAALAVLML